MYEVSAEAGSYRGELLGLLAIHTFILPVSLFYEVSTQRLGLVACDNKGALFKAKVFRKRIPPGAKHGDILRCLRRTLYSLRSRLDYKHVYGHQDWLKSWSQLTLLEKLNCKCDTLAKTAVYLGAANSARATHQRQSLPHEPASVFHKGKKLSNDCGDEIRFQVYLRIARKFFVEELGWHGATFDDVDWDQRDACLRGKPEMYQLWLSKQSTGFCATGVNMGRWFDATVTSCPNCSSPKETAGHLLRCKDVGRTKLFKDTIISLEEWMESHYTDPRLARAVSLFLQHRGNRKFASFPGLDRDLLELAHKQDAIGWDDFLEGKITKHFQVVQARHLPRCPTMLNASDWSKRFIDQLIHITQSQWIYRNISKHHATHGQLERLDRISLLRHINKFAGVAPTDVPQESRFLLEVDFVSLVSGHTTQQAYWVHALQAAIKAGRHRSTAHRLRRRPLTTTPSAPLHHPPTTLSSTPAVGNRRKRSRPSTNVLIASNKRKRPDWINGTGFSQIYEIVYP
jgi:hypothetical protein